VPRLSRPQTGSHGHGSYEDLLADPEVDAAYIAEFSSGFTSNHRGLEAIGRDGSVRATDLWQSSPATIWRDGAETVLEAGDPYVLELEDMAAAIRGERPALPGRADALGQARVIDALYRSAETGAAVRL
jgi:predicted dehydrogenase